MDRTWNYDHYYHSGLWEAFAKLFDHCCQKMTCELFGRNPGQ